MGLFLQTLKLRLYAFAKIPLIFFCRPSVIRVDEHECVVRLPLRRRTKNHVGSLYFGALAVGADLCVGLLALTQIERSGKNIVLIFKDFKADFKKLAKGGDVHFISRDGDKVRELVARAAASGERQNATIRGFAVVPAVHPTESVMDFELTLSLKSK